MKKNNLSRNATLRNVPLGILSIAISALIQAQETVSETYTTPDASRIEEVIAIGRLRTTADELILERMEQEVATDAIGADQIGRIGDSTVAAALRRVTGVTLIDDKFVYVRGLGERYSNTLLNGAVVPSPDLTRSVIPLDIFPTSVVKSIVVQKDYSADMPASFAGGVVDIRTKGIPNDFELLLEVGSGYNSESSGDFLSYGGASDNFWGDDASSLPSEISQSLVTYKGSFDRNNILATLNKDGTTHTLAEAEAINKEIATALDRDINIKKDSGDLDFNGKVSIGDTFSFNLFSLNNIEFGYLASISRDAKWRNSEKIERELSSPSELVDFADQSTHSIDSTANLNVGLRLNDEHSIETTSLFLRNTDEKTSITDSFGSNRPLSSGAGDRTYSIRYEQRELTVNQIKGEHEFGLETRELLGLESLAKLDGLKFNWYFSDSKVTTDIPNEVSVGADVIFEPGTREELSSSVVRTSSAGDFRYTALEDNVDSYGWELALPLTLDRFDMALSGGWDYHRKTRTYRQTQFSLGTNESDADSILSGSLDTVFSDENILNPDSGFRLGIISGNAESYIAANKVTAMFGKYDVTWNETIRVALGLRQENYQQVAVPWAPLNYTGSQIPTDVEELQRSVLNEEDTYPSLSVVYMAQDFWAQDFQLRFSYSETAVRPDLREMSSASYRDPITDFLVFGNPDVIPSSIDNYSVRGEWYFDNGDNLTLTAFYKDITSPIELTETAAADENRAVKIINAESAEVTGFEVEFLKNLGDVADILNPFFLQGNAIWLDTNVVVGNLADGPTNSERPLQGASDALNLILGFDSPNGLHSATLSYNTFGERLYFAGRNEEPDAYEQPANSLDFTYFFYPTDELTVKLKMKNLLNEDIVIERNGVESLTKTRGQTFSISAKYNF